MQKGRMFCINYEILENEKKSLSKIKSIEEFETNFGIIEGQIQLVCNDKEVGFVDKNIPYDGELLFTWFQKLNEVLVMLENNKSVMMWIPDSADLWIEFKKENARVTLSKVRVQSEGCVVKVITGLSKKEELFWEESILVEELVEGIFTATSQFMQELHSLNPLLGKIEEVVKLEKVFEKAKQIWNLHDGE